MFPDHLQIEETCKNKGESIISYFLERLSG